MSVSNLFQTFVAWLNSCLKESWKIWIGDLQNGLSADVFITLMEALTGDEIVNEVSSLINFLQLQNIYCIFCGVS